MAEENAVEWVIDKAASSSEDESESVHHIVATARRIPRYKEKQALQSKLKRANITGSSAVVSELLKKSVIQPGFEQLKSVPRPVTSRRALRRERKKERDRTKGPGWYNLPALEMTEEIQNDVDLLRMRSVLDTKHFYKKNDLSHIPKYFQMGTVVEGAADFYSGRIPKSQRKSTLLGELMADSDIKAAQKTKYKEILSTNYYLRKRKRKSDFKKEEKKKNRSDLKSKEHKRKQSSDMKKKGKKKNKL